MAGRLLSLRKATAAVLAAAAVFCLAAVLRAEDDLQRLQQQLDALSRKVEETSDPAELAQLMQEMLVLSAQLAAAAGGAGPAAALPGRAATPEEEVDRVIADINQKFGAGYRLLQRYAGEEVASRMPLTRATRVHGRLLVHGKESEPPQNGWVPLELAYGIEERFVGYLTVTRHYDPPSGRPVGEPQYSLATISTGVRVPQFSGRQCVRITGGPLVQCAAWGRFDRYEVNPGDVYPAVHEWVVLGETAPGKVRLKAEVPVVIFRSGDSRAVHGIYCGVNAFFEMDIDEFTETASGGRLALEKPIGADAHGPPNCQAGSRLELKMEICPPEAFEDAGRCRQLEKLARDLTFVLRLRDAFAAAGPAAADLDQLREMVSLEVGEAFPGTDLNDEAQFADRAGAYNFCDAGVAVPDQCSTGCAPYPRCRWQTEALGVHEQTHAADAAADPGIRKLFCDSTYYMARYPEVAVLARARAETYARLDRHAYDEQARYLLDLLERQMAEGGACSFPPRFYTVLMEARQALR